MNKTVKSCVMSQNFSKTSVWQQIVLGKVVNGFGFCSQKLCRGSGPKRTRGQVRLRVCAWRVLGSWVAPGALFRLRPAVHRPAGGHPAEPAAAAGPRVAPVAAGCPRQAGSASGICCCCVGWLYFFCLFCSFSSPALFSKGVIDLRQKISLSDEIL